MQEAIIVKGNRDSESLIELNAKLKEGWKIIHTCCMSGSEASPTCLVIIERIG